MESVEFGGCIIHGKLEVKNQRWSEISKVKGEVAGVGNIG